MDPSHNFPPSPRDMYMYRPPQQMNGHNVQSPSPSRGRPPPVLPERKPETQLSNRTSRSSVNSRGSSFSDVASPPLSPVSLSHGHHAPQFHHQPHTHSPDNKSFAYVPGINPESTVKTHISTESNSRVRGERDSSPCNRRGSNRNDDFVTDGQNDGAVYQRIDRNRVSSSPDRSLTGELGYHQVGGTFHPGNNLRHSEGIYGQFVEPSSGSPHRPSLTYVPPPVVPTLQPDLGKVDKGVKKDQQHHLQQQQQQQQQHKVVSHSDSTLTSMPLDTASHHHNHHHHCNHHHSHPQHVVPSHQHHHPLASTSSPLASPKLFRPSKRVKPKQESIPPPPTIPIPALPTPLPDKYISAVTTTRTPSPALPTPLPDKYISAVTTTRTPSPPLPPPPSEINTSSKSRSSKKGIEPNPPSPLAASTTTHTYQHCMQSPTHHCYHNNHHHHQNTDQSNELSHGNHYQVKTTSVPAPPPPPPPPSRASSVSQLTGNHQQDLNPTPPGVRSSRSGSPARPSGAMPHSLKQPSLATLDDLAQVKLRAVTDASQSNPHSPLVSPVATSDGGSGAINVRLRPTPGKFRNIYAEDASTLPPPPPLDDLDELPPPPPPPELLCHDPAPFSLDSTTTQRSLPPSSHLQAGEADFSQIDHNPQQQRQQQVTNSPQKVHHSSSESCSRSGGISGALEGASGLEQLILESISNMDFEIPDDIDLSQCPGLMEINKSTPNWKRDMIEKKNQEKIEEYVRKILKEREQEAKWKNVPEWKRKILQKKEEEDGIVANPSAQEVKPATVKKPTKKAPVPAPKETKEEVASSKSKSDIVPAALSIDPEELAAMPPWKRELLFKRDKVPVTFSNEFNPEDENENVPMS